MKQILITEEQLDKILREELCRFTAEEVDTDFEGFVQGLRLTIKLADVAEKILDRLFRSGEGVKQNEI